MMWYIPGTRTRLPSFGQTFYNKVGPSQKFMRRRQEDAPARVLPLGACGLCLSGCMLETQCLLRISGSCPGYDRPQYRSWWPALPGRPQTNDTFLTRTACMRAQHGWQKTCGHLTSVRLKLVTLAPTQKRRASLPLSSPSSRGTDGVDVGAPAVAATINDAPNTSFWIY